MGNAVLKDETITTIKTLSKEELTTALMIADNCIPQVNKVQETFAKNFNIAINKLKLEIFSHKIKYAVTLTEVAEDYKKVQNLLLLAFKNDLEKLSSYNQNVLEQIICSNTFSTLFTNDLSAISHSADKNDLIAALKILSIFSNKEFKIKDQKVETLKNVIKDRLTKPFAPTEPTAPAVQGKISAIKVAAIVFSLVLIGGGIWKRSWLNSTIYKIFKRTKKTEDIQLEDKKAVDNLDQEP